MSEHNRASLINTIRHDIKSLQKIRNKLLNSFKSALL